MIFAGPYAVYLLLFLAIPFANVAVLSFYTYSPARIAVPDLTLANYARLWDPYYGALFLRTMRLGLVATLCCAVLGFPVAYFLARARPHIVTIGILLLITPLMISTVIRVFGWMVILGRNGMFNQLLAWLGFEPRGSLLYNETAVVIGLVQLFLPFMVLPLMAAIEKIPRNLEEAAQNLGANWMQTFARTILPLSLPGLLSGSVLVYTVSISAYVTPALMGGPRFRMVGQQVYDDVLSSFNWPGASGIAIILIILTMLLLFVASYAAERAGRREAAG